MVQHDLLQDVLKNCICISSEIEGNTILCGFFFANNIKGPVIVDSGTGYKYLLNIPETYLNVPFGSQFNVSLTFDKVKNDTP